MKYIFLLLITSSIWLFAGEDNLQRAYAKEFAYLKAQKEMLKKRLEEVESQNAKNISNAKKEIDRLQKSVLKKTALSEKLSDELFRSQQNFQTINDDTAAIESVLLQSNSTLKPYGIDIVVDKNRYQESLKNIFEQSDKLIKRLSSINIENGKFYAQDGSQVEGEIIKIGNIAAYGISGGTSGALVPAGNGEMKIYKAPQAAKSAKDIKNADLSAPLNIFIYENSTKEVEDVKEKTVEDIIDSGGIIGWVIVVLGLIGLILAVLRFFFLLGANSTTSSLAKDTLGKLLEGGVEGALEFLKPKKGSTARLLKATVRNLNRDREHIEDIVAESILHESSRLDKFGSTILVIAAVAPLLGLLGTVTGMIATFDIITEFGTGDPKLLSGGISIALVTTELGLIVAIPILMIGNLLGGWAEKVKDSMEHSALHLINEYAKHK